MKQAQSQKNMVHLPLIVKNNKNDLKIKDQPRSFLLNMEQSLLLINEKKKTMDL